MTSEKEALNINNKLSYALTVTSIGDYLSLFAYIVAMEQITNNPLIASLIIPMKAFGSAGGSVVSPYLFRKIPNKIGLCFSQFFLFFASLIVVKFLSSNQHQLIVSILILFLSWLHGFSQQYFQNAKESYSKSIEEKAQQHNKEKINTSLINLLVVNLEKGLIFGQIFGSLIFVILYSYFKVPIIIPILIDTFTFLISGLICLSLPNLKIKWEHSFTPFSSLRKYFENAFLLKIFLFRFLILWISYGIFNIALFGIIQHTMNVPIENSAYIYFAGAIASYLFTQYIQPVFSKKSNYSFLPIGVFLYSIGQIFFSFQNSFSFSCFLWIIVNAVGCTIIKINSRGILRSLTSEQSYGDILSIEFLFGKIIETITSLLFVHFFQQGLSYTNGTVISSFVLVVGYFLFFKSGIILSAFKRNV